jgi:hypothetical protein
MASAEELRAQFGARRDQAMQRMMALGVVRNKYIREQEAKIKAEAAKEKQRLQAAQKESSANWLNTAGMGAQLGSMGGPGWGTAIGAGAGALVGLMGATKAQGGGLKGFGKALVNPMGNKFDGMSDIPLGGLVAGGLAGGKAMGLGAAPAGGVTQGELDAAFTQMQDPTLMGSSGGFNAPPPSTMPLSEYQKKLDAINAAANYEEFGG